MLGNDPFEGARDQAVAGEKLNGRALLVRLHGPERAAGCHILYIDASEIGRLSQILGSVHRRSVLTVSDIEGFARDGGVIRFLLVDSHVKLRINIQAARERAHAQLEAAQCRASWLRRGPGSGMPLRYLPIGRKHMVMLFVTSGTVLALTCASFIGYQYVAYRSAARHNLMTLSCVIASNSTAALALDDANDAREVLDALRAESRVRRAAPYNSQGTLFAWYPTGLPASAFPRSPAHPGVRFQGGALIGYRSVRQGGNGALGTLWGQRLTADNEVPSLVDWVLNKPPRLRDLRLGLREMLDRT